MRSKTLATLALTLALAVSASACASRRAPAPAPGAGVTPDAAMPADPLGTAPAAAAGQPGGPGDPAAGGAAGAPAAGPGSQQDFVISAGERVFFDTDSYSLRDDALPILAAQAQWLQRYPNVRVIIEGNADERGTREYNLGLGARRAAAVREHLIGQGVAAARIETVSYGKERPIDSGSDESAWGRNRNARTNFQGG